MFPKTSTVSIFALSALLGSSSVSAWISSAAGDRYTCGGTGPENYYNGATSCPKTVDGTALSGYSAAIVYSEDTVTDYTVSVTCSYGATECVYGGALGTINLIAGSDNPSECTGSVVIQKKAVSDILFTSCPKLGKNGTAWLWSATVDGGSDSPTVECQYLGATEENGSFGCTYSTDGELVSSSGASTYCPTTGCSALSSGKKRAMVAARLNKNRKLTEKKRSATNLSTKSSKRKSSKRKAAPKAVKKTTEEAELQGEGLNFISQWGQGSTAEDLEAEIGSASTGTAEFQNLAVAVDSGSDDETVPEAEPTVQDFSNQWTEGNEY